MAALFALSKKGLDHLISTTGQDDGEAFLFQLLMYSSDQPASMGQMASWFGLDQKQTAVTVYRLLKQGWLRSVEQDAKPDEPVSLYSESLSGQLSRLSSCASVILADTQGLVISKSGFEDTQIEYLAASAARMIGLNEMAKKANPGMVAGRPWSIQLNWGDRQILVQPVDLNLNRFVLIVGGLPQLDSHAYFNLLARLARRYGSGY